MAIGLAFVLACSEDDSGNCLTESEEGSNWLTIQIQDIQNSGIEEYFYVTQASYLGQTVFIFGNCCPFCLTITPVYDCSGEVLGILGTGPDAIDPSLIKNERLFWKPEDFVCQLDF